MVLDPELTREINKAGKLEFTILDDHPLFGKLKKLKYGIIVENDGKTVFKGRIIDTEQVFDKNIFVTVEGKLGALNDSPCRPYSFKGTPEELFAYFIDNHNEQVGTEQQFKKGNVIITDPNNYISRSWEKTDKTLNLIKSRLIDTLGGFLVIRYEEDGDYLDWIDEFTIFSTQKVEFGENLLDLSMFIDATSTYTACIPYGAKDEEGNVLTVKEVNNGKDYIINEELAAEYGTIYPPSEETTWDDVTIPDNLLKKGTEWLYGEGITFFSSIELDFLDLSKLGFDVGKVDIYQNVYVISEPHGLETSFLVEKMREKLGSPEDIKITVGKTLKTLTDRTLGEKRKSESFVTNQGLANIKPFLHIRYSPVENPTAEQMTEEPQPNSVYTGLCHSSSEGAPTDPSEYTWQKTVGDNGEDAVTLRIDSSRGTVFKNNQCETVLSAVIYKGSKRITDITALRGSLGSSAYLEWKWQRMGEETFGTILATDKRIGNDGFTFTLSPNDVDTKVVFMCQLITD